MALSINIPDTPWSRQNISLAGKTYRFTFTYNERSKRWYLEISLGSKTIISSVKIIEGVDLIGRYVLDDFDHGKLFCAPQKQTSDTVGRDNFGIGKDYELFYFTNEELEQLGN